MNRKVTITSFIILTLVSIALLISTLHYHALYLQTPQTITKTVTHSKVVNQRYFDPNRSASYTCTPAGSNMICRSPDNTVEVNCTSVGLPVTDYYC